MNAFALCLLSSCCAVLPPAEGPLPSRAIRQIDLRAHWDSTAALQNPHKGWYHHFPDNHPNKYKVGRDSDLLEFPGMDHLYIRIAWSYLEPEEERFDWSMIDDLVEKWVANGLGISFRISCKETSTDRIEQQYATPRWVKEAGAKGGYYRQGKAVGPDGPWEPVFDDPIFLEKLEKFLAAFAARYDGKTWLRYVDIGSLGDWGEGHTWAGSRIEYGFDARKIHVDLHLKHFRKTLLIATDDFVYGIADRTDRDRMHRYILENGISYRDDSILVNGYLAGHAATWTVRSPELFADTYLRTPTILELEHYGHVKRQGNWLGAPGSSLEKHGRGKKGADFFRGALALLRATYIGYHGDAREWLDDNPELTAELLNYCGYWYFLHRVTLPESVQAGQKIEVEALWENRGVAPAYNPFTLVLRLRGAETVQFEIDSGNRRWLPNESWLEKYSFSLPASIKPGIHSLGLKLHSREAGRDVRLALTPKLLDKDGFYEVASIVVSSQTRPAR
jgi:hypothetical protein